MSILVLSQVYEDARCTDTYHFTIAQSATFDDFLAELMKWGHTMPGECPDKNDNESAKEKAEWKDVKLHPPCHRLSEVSSEGSGAFPFHFISAIALISGKIPTPPPEV